MFNRELYLSEYNNAIRDIRNRKQDAEKKLSEALAERATLDEPYREAVLFGNVAPVQKKVDAVDRKICTLREQLQILDNFRSSGGEKLRGICDSVLQKCEDGISDLEKPYADAFSKMEKSKAEYITALRECGAIVSESVQINSAGENVVKFSSRNPNGGNLCFFNKKLNRNGCKFEPIPEKVQVQLSEGRQ